MNITNIKPTMGNILDKKLPDETTTKAGIILPKNQPVNKQTVHVEVIAVGESPNDNIYEKIVVKPGDRGIVGRVPYENIQVDGEEYWFVKQVDIIALV